MIKLNFFYFPLILSLFLILPLPSDSQEESSPDNTPNFVIATDQAQVLTGIRAFRVLVSIEGDRSGTSLSETQICNVIEGQLRQAGISIDDSNGFRLGARIMIIKIENTPTYCIAYQLYLREFSVLYRYNDDLICTDSVFSEVTSWEYETIGYAGSLVTMNQCRDAFLSLADQFVNDYLTANPRYYEPIGKL